MSTLTDDDAFTLSSIESRIAYLISQQFCTSAENNLSSTCANTLQKVVKQAIVSSEGGKRLRALLTIAAFNSFTDENNTSKIQKQSIFDIACALEVFQTAALIHDDIIDESALRRGKPSAYCALSASLNNKHIGAGLGIMLGDLLATESFDIARSAAKNFTYNEELLEAFASMQKNVGIGQVLDLSIEMMDLSDPLQLAKSSLNVFRWKTASYTTVAPLTLGFLAGSMKPDEAYELALLIGDPLGIAFQLADDLLDIVSDSKHTGKPIGGDIREGKRAVLLADALQYGNSEERDTLLKAYLSKSRSEDDVEKIIKIYYSTGAIENSIKRISKLWQESQKAIDNSQLTSSGKNLLHSISERFIPEVWRNVQ
ncbi:polyprenyl synthetase family protein [Bifidobacteriaceae bacterium NR002]|nr:polyprenyl synthetase family protein [Bifidobacteriaceae bacterium NR002]MDZ7549679.1 polyprenyl synthetase family protein [Bifidobacteriaceae bacterium NR047]